MSTTVIACIQQIPRDNAEAGADDPLDVQEISATAEDYLSAVDEVHTHVPEGWRVLYVRTDGPAAASEPAAATADTPSDPAADLRRSEGRDQNTDEDAATSTS